MDKYSKHKTKFVPYLPFAIIEINYIKSYLTLSRFYLRKTRKDVNI